MTTSERAVRNAQIVEAKANGSTCRDVAAEHGLSMRQVRRIWRGGSDTDVEPDEFIASVYAALHEEREFDGVLRQVREENAGVTLAEISERQAGRRRRIELLKLIAPRL